MELKHLEYFLEVTRMGSFTKAADNLYMTQPAISRIIKSLEVELGVELFIRSRKQLILTDAGKILLRRAEAVHEELGLLRTDLERLTTFQKGHLRIGLPSIVQSSFFSELIADFHQEYPEVTFQLEEDGSKGIEEMVLAGKLDFGVVVLPNTHNYFDYYSFDQEQLMLVVPSHHGLAKQQEAKLENLSEEAFILFTSDFKLRNTIVHVCKQIGFEPRIISETSQLDYIEEMVASGLGITLLPESTCKDLTGDVEIISLHTPVIEWNLGFIWHHEAQLSRIAKEFIRYTKEKLASID